MDEHYRTPNDVAVPRDEIARRPGHSTFRRVRDRGLGR